MVSPSSALDAAATQTAHNCYLPSIYNNAQNLHIGITLQELMAIIGAICAILSWSVMVPLGLLHLRNWTNPGEQRHMVRIIFVIPLIATCNAFMLIFYGAAWYIHPLPDMVEAFGVASLFYLFVTYITPNESVREQYYDNLERRDRKGRSITGEQRQGSLRWFHNIWVLIFQILIGRLATLIASEILTATECPISDKLEHRRTIVNVIGTAVTVIALVAILRYYARLKEELRPRGAVHQLLAYKGLIFLALVPNTIIQALVSFTVIVPSTYISYLDWQIGIPALITCSLMFAFSPLFWGTFSASPYRSAAKQGQRRDSFGSGLLLVINLLDILKGVGLMFRLRSGANYDKLRHESMNLDSVTSDRLFNGTQSPLPQQQQQLGGYQGSLRNPQQYHHQYSRNHG
ncbi:MAG: hypothetical protein Q9170_006492 [Blastenia crenularia]